jgi:hypothetical protein
MHSLLEIVINAHGGLNTWSKINNIKFRAKIDGLLWQMKGQPELLNDTYITVDTKKQFLTYQSANGNLSTSYDPNCVRLNLQNGYLDKLENPRESFAAHTKETQWTALQTIYFASYAMWNYINIPFVFAKFDYQEQEIEPWKENGEVWKRLKVIFPQHIATHTPVQTFYIDDSGLIRRHDYKVDIIGTSIGSAHYLYDYKDINGIKISTKRKVFARLEDNTSKQPDPLLVSIDLSEILLSMITYK